MKIAITAETTIDLTKELLDKYDIKTIASSVILGEQEYKDGQIPTSDIFAFAEENKILPKTSAINSAQYSEFFSGVLKEYDAVIHISLSSKMSSMCNNAKLAAGEMNNVYVIDSQTLSTGIALLAIKAREFANSGLDVSEVYNRIVELRPKVQASFVIKKLDYLYKGGRCSAVSYFGANLMKIRPQIIVKDGSMGVHKKYLGKYERVILNYSKDVLEEFNDADLDVAFVTYTTATEDMIEVAKKACIEKGFKEVYVTTAGATIASHCGENTLGILYITNNKIS